ncbi:TetR/AcrR family transcriptional regulator [Paraburkholderia sp. J7]|uniref:TetR/AcrR family transcriptional regulator n=1 Tax=Paraburkholderia sp. J7 TaxID=2805438 RepID=UPI002AB6E263|nr:TetR family transcriptional regulator [Paraburkholderia sp. J7]
MSRENLERSQCREPIRSTLLEGAERLIRERGYAAFSLPVLAQTLSVEELSIAKYFRNREDACTELVERLILRVGQELGDIYREYGDAQSRLIAYACLRSEEFVCGVPSLSAALGAAHASLPDTIRTRVSDLLALQLDWIRNVVQDHFGSFHQRAGVSSTQAAKLLLVALEGDAMLECVTREREPSASGYVLMMAVLGLNERAE